MIMNAKRTVLVAAGVLGCLAVGAAFEHVRQALAVPAAPAEADDSSLAKVRLTPTVRTLTVTNDPAARAANQALRSRIAELEQALAKTANTPAVAEPANPPEERREDRPRRQSFTERLEQMKTENPEQYAEFQKQREEERQSREQRAQARVSFLDTIGTQNMNPEQRENHEKLVATIAKLSEYRALMEQPGFERTPEIRQELGEAFGSLGELYGVERRYLLEETARAVGYEGGQVTEFADQMQTIIDNTTMSGFGHQRGGGRDGGGGGTASAAGER